jgi:oligoribonuclease NrnB/cAMP/cGMP phosphodiesterase (DHH superfamily)
MKTRLVIFHAACMDGFGAAWAVWKKFGDADTEYLPAKYGDAPPDVTGRDVIITDFSYKRDVMLALSKAANQLLCLDHHKTAEADLKDLPFARFDMERSGAGMTWDHFHVVPRPWLIDYVEDRDLWRFKLPQSKEVNALINTVARESFDVWDKLSQMTVEEAAQKGAGALAFLDSYVREMLSQARRLTFAGYEGVPVVNAPYVGISELVSALAEGKQFAVGWFQREDGLYQYSLRSRGDFDVTEIAKRFGGGGHKQAAGFTSTRVPEALSG